MIIRQHVVPSDVFPTRLRFLQISQSPSLAGEDSRICRTLGGAASGAGVSSHGDGLLVLLDVLEEGNSALKLPAVDGLGGLASVLERNSEVGTASAGRLRGLDLGGSVSNLFKWKKPSQS